MPLVRLLLEDMKGAMEARLVPACVRGHEWLAVSAELGCPDWTGDGAALRGRAHA
jgi:hypothetical protein